jgi:hypothetical protein
MPPSPTKIVEKEESHKSVIIGLSVGLAIIGLSVIVIISTIVYRRTMRNRNFNLPSNLPSENINLPRNLPSENFNLPSENINYPGKNKNPPGIAIDNPYSTYFTQNTVSIF